MKMPVYILAALMIAGVVTAANSSDPARSDESVLNFYRQQSSYTDPGKYKDLYKDLPTSLPELCQVVKSQSIHPFAELPRYKDQIPEERWNAPSKDPMNAAFEYLTVESILTGLLSLDSSGLVKERKLEHRLVLGCRENALLLASILKQRGIPVRFRYGFALYLRPGLGSSHAICEVWNETDKRWMLVDPTTGMIDFDGKMFEFSNEAWLKMQSKEIDPKLYGPGGKFNGLPSLTHMLCHDLAAVLGTEFPINHYSPLFEPAIKNDGQMTLSENQIRTLGKISELMNSIDSASLTELRKISRDTPEIQVTQIEKTSSPEPTTVSTEHSAGRNDSSDKKPIIEFVDIPGGNFIMGSPATEEGRGEDETQHRVTLSAFKMSKYPVTYAQYDLFCEATGRKKPFGFKRGNLPVTQVTWHDANAFAKWMNCRLPTEAEWEYAARANTTTAFHTGDSLTSTQANFGGKGTSPVGSFPPNAFGLHDMHGNVWEWCNDWYDAHGTTGVTDPQGPDNGKRKVNRGGCWSDPAWRCRSAYRAGGDPPGNRGAGLGFRVVKLE